MTRNSIKNMLIAVLTARWMMTLPVWIPDAFATQMDVLIFMITMSGILYYCIRDFESWLIKRHDKKLLRTYRSRKGAINDRDSRYGEGRRIYDDRTA